VKVLAIDGGGIRGLIPALVLAEIERRSERRIASLFDLIAGTSTGAVLACVLTRPNAMPAERAADLYEREGPQVFDRSLVKRITSLGGSSMSATTRVVWLPRCAATLETPVSRRPPRGC
jgi:uncharacterized protein